MLFFSFLFFSYNGSLIIVAGKYVGSIFIVAGYNVPLCWRSGGVWSQFSSCSVYFLTGTLSSVRSSEVSLIPVP